MPCPLLAAVADAPWSPDIVLPPCTPPTPGVARPWEGPCGDDTPGEYTADAGGEDQVGAAGRELVEDGDHAVPAGKPAVADGVDKPEPDTFDENVCRAVPFVGGGLATRGGVLIVLLPAPCGGRAYGTAYGCGA